MNDQRHARAARTEMVIFSGMLPARFVELARRFHNVASS
jgi:hypothetical protein